MNVLRFSHRALLGLGLSVLSLATFSFTGCGGDEDEKGKSAPTANSAGGESKPSSTVVVDGSSTVYRISENARETFEKVDSTVNVVVDKHGTGGGFGRYLKGEVDIIDASRKAKAEEAEKAKAQGIDWTEFKVGYDGITVVVNKKNTFVNELSVDDLKKIFAAESKIKTWKDLNPAWPDKKLVIYTPDKDSGTFEFFVDEVLGKGSKQRDDIQASADDNVLVLGVSGDADAIGYFGYAYFVSNNEKLRAVPIKAKADAKAVEPNPETILKGTYAPLARPLFIYVKNSAMSRPAVASFVKYYLENIDTLVKKALYVPPTDEDKAKNKAGLEALGPKK